MVELVAEEKKNYQEKYASQIKMYAVRKTQFVFDEKIKTSSMYGN